MPIVCVAIVNQANDPIYMKSFKETQDPLEFDFLAFSALDMIEEKLAPGSRQAVSYLGVLFATEEFKVFGYATSTNIKFLFVVDSNDFKEFQIKKIFESFYTAYANAVSNPFYKMGTPLHSATFDKQVENLRLMPLM